MRHFLFATLGLGLMLPAFVSAAVYAPTRDSYMRGSDDAYRGAAQNGRVAKYNNLSYYFSDFDRTAIANEIKAINGKLPGDTLTLADVANVDVTWSLKSRLQAEIDPSNPDYYTLNNAYLAYNYRPTVLRSRNDWTEAQVTNNWAKFIAAGDPGNVPWVTPTTGVTANAFNAEFRNITNANWEAWGGTAGNSTDGPAPDFYRAWALDDAVVYAYLTDPYSVGLAMNQAGNDTNLNTWSKEAAVDNRPFLTVTGTPIPEPASLGLVALGGLLAVRRRRA